MELRVLEYYLTVAREQNITKAAQYLHLTQPTLSRQLKELEDEFGKQLLIRGKRKVTLTEDGILFRKLAGEIVSLAKRAETEMKQKSTSLAGNLYIGTGESEAIGNIIQIAHDIQQDYPDVHFHFISGDTSDLIDRLDKGLFDFCIFFGDVNHSEYEYITLPYTEEGAVLMPKDAPLASKEYITASDLWDVPLIISRNDLYSPNFFQRIGKKPEELNITNTSNLVYTAVHMTEKGMGYLLTLANLVNTNGTNLCYRPIRPCVKVNLTLVWKKYRTQSKVAEKFIQELSDRLVTS